MQKSQGAKSTARRRPLHVLSGNRTPHPPPTGSIRRKPPAAVTPSPFAAAATHSAFTAAATHTAFATAATPSAPAAAATPSAPAAATAEPALDRLLLASSNLAGLVSQIDELVSSALHCEKISRRGEQEIESFSAFLSDTNSSLKQWSSRLKQALAASPARTENAAKQPVEVFPKSAAKGTGQLFRSSSILPQAGPATSPSHNLVHSSTTLPETDLIVSPSPLVSWRTGSCMVESGKQLFLLTPLPKTKACSSRCPGSSKTQPSMDELNLPNLPVWKLTISDDSRPDPEQSVKETEARASAAAPQLIEAKKGSSEDSFSFSIQKSRRALPSPYLATALRGKQHVFSPISEGSSKDGILSAGPAESDKPSAASDEMLSDEKDLASRYPDMYGFNVPTGDVRRRRETDEALDWFLSPLKTCVLMDPSPTDDKPIPIPVPAKDNKSLIGTPWKCLESKKLKGGQELSDDSNPIQTPAVHCKPLLGTPWKGLESTNLKGRHAGETTLKRELWTRFEAVSTNDLHFDKSVFHKSDGRRFIDMLEEES